ncbi:MAG: helix-turn-helix transcriptional regulator [Kiloniellales bacterium]|nr:helix-turn-helix transcriptional regulator [Kiloniellales bacterium]
MPALPAKTASRPGKTTPKAEKTRDESALSSVLIGEIYKAAFFPDLWAAVLSGTTALLDSTKALLFFYDAKANTRRVHKAHGVEPTFISTFEGKLAQDTPWLGRDDGSDSAGPVAVGDSAVAVEPAGTPSLFAEFLRQQNVGPTLHACVGTFGQEQLHLTVARPASGTPYCEAEREVCQQVVEHLRNALHLKREADQHQVVERGAMEALNRLAVGVAMVDSRGEICATNTAAESMLALGDGLHFDLGQTEVCVDGCRGSLRTALGRLEWCRQNPDASCPALFAVHRPSRARPYAVLACPFRRSDELPLGEPFYHLVFFFDPDQSLCGHSVDFLKRYYDLTPAEARLAKLIAEGERLDGIAERLGISVHTARTHLKRVFEKTGVERQAELVQLMFGCLGLMQDNLAAMGGSAAAPVDPAA